MNFIAKLILPTALCLSMQLLPSAKLCAQNTIPPDWQDRENQYLDSLLRYERIKVAYSALGRKALADSVFQATYLRQVVFENADREKALRTAALTGQRRARGRGRLEGASMAAGAYAGYRLGRLFGPPGGLVGAGLGAAAGALAPNLFLKKPQPLP